MVSSILSSTSPSSGSTTSTATVQTNSLPSGWSLASNVVVPSAWMPSGATSNIGSNIISSITGSSTNYQSLAANLTNATSQPQQLLLNNRQTATQATVSAIGQVVSSANSFQTALTALGDTKAIAYQSQSSDPTIADFAFQSFIQPTPVNLTFSVNQLATNNVVTLPPIPTSAPSLLGSSTGTGRQLTLYSGQSIAPALISSANEQATITIANGKLTPGDVYNISVPVDGGGSLSASVTVPPSGLAGDFATAINNALSSSAASASITAGYPNASASSDGKTVTFDYGSTSTASGTITLTPTKVLQTFDLGSYSTLPDLAAAINAVSGYSASVMNSTSGSTPVQYLQISHGTGTANNFIAQITDNSTPPNSNLSDGLNTSTNGGAIVSSGEDAVITSSGVTYTSSTNTFSNLISGVNINVHAVTSGDNQVTLSTAANTTAQISALQAIVQGYNSLLATIKSTMTYNADVNKRGGLANDPIAQEFLSQLSAYTTTPIKGSGATPVTLSSIGVKTNLDGTLSIDIATVDNVSQNNPQLISDVISSSSNSTGALDLMKNLNNVLIGTTGQNSIFSDELNTLNTTVEQKIADDQTALNKTMQQLYQNYLTQFSAIQSLLSSTQSQQTSLTNMMSAWTAGLKA
jgi:flagellar hook-associated protein 2